MTVLQIIPAFGTGGAEQACYDMAAALCARGDKALIVSEDGGWRIPMAQKVGARFIDKNVATKNPLLIIRNAFWLAKLIRREKVDIVHARSRAPAWSAWIACRMTKCPFVTTAHAAYKYDCALKKTYNRVMAAGDRVIAISGYIADILKNEYGVNDNRLRLVNRGVDVAQLQPSVVSQDRVQALRSAWAVEENERVILFPARLSPIKGHEMLIRALGLLRKKGTDLPLTLIVGDDQGREAYSQKLHDVIEEEGLKGRVKLVGACSDMPAAYALAQLVVQPSKEPEGFGRVPVEAMAMGLPVIASAVGAMRYTVLDGKTGWLVKAEDKEGWARAVAKALSLSEADRQKMASTARDYVCQNFTSETMIARTLAVYDEMRK
ncbi:MAG: glycosyltransferase family 4 protein [Alphaproteobacteria bacterium]|nr:glycosyltransferase family 4 protein [Alphaproteobacteria bacterium]